MKKGFTIVELLAVVTLLLVIILVTLPSIVNLTKNSEEREKEELLNNIYMATENYIMLNYEICNELDNVGGSCYVYVNTLINNDYIKANLANPNTGTNFVSDDIVKVTRNEDNTFSYELTKLED